MHYFKTLPTIAALSTIIAASVASLAPAPAPAEAAVGHPTKEITFKQVTAAPGPEALLADDFVGVLRMATGNNCDGSTLTWEISGSPGAYGCLPVPAGWVTESVEFSQGIGNLGGCYATTWAQAGCKGQSYRIPVQECATIPYAAVSVSCPA